MNAPIESEIILNEDGSIYHLRLHPEQVAEDIITVGDPDRVAMVSKYFDTIEHQVQKREFVTHTGTLNGKRITVISTGIGTDNVDIVINEIEALKNYDLPHRKRKEDFTPLRFYRVGTSGGLLESVEVDSIVISSFGIGLDGLMHFYDYAYDIDEKEIAMKVNKRLHQTITNIKSYTCRGSDALIGKFSAMGKTGFTLTASGFYGPQGRRVITRALSETFLTDMKDVAYQGQYITNLEMETAALYGLANMLGHQAVSCNVILANRTLQTFSKDPKTAVDRLIREFLETLTKD